MNTYALSMLEFLVFSLSCVKKELNSRSPLSATSKYRVAIISGRPFVVLKALCSIWKWYICIRRPRHNHRVSKVVDVDGTEVNGTEPGSDSAGKQKTKTISQIDARPKPRKPQNPSKTSLVPSALLFASFPSQTRPDFCAPDKCSAQRVEGQRGKKKPNRKSMVRSWQRPFWKPSGADFRTQCATSTVFRTVIFALFFSYS